MRRYLQQSIQEDLARKMVFVAGPRQVGKTTLARQILESVESGCYLSWDRREDRGEIRAARWPAGSPALVVLDELHKWRTWKRWLKGEFDAHRESVRFLVTGSARLDIYRRGGDSLQGRYHHYRLHPLSLHEVQSPASAFAIEPGQALAVARAPGEKREGRETLAALLRFGGFPEPFLAQSERAHRRWQKDRLDRLFREDVRDLEAVRDLAALELLAEEIARRVGSPLSLNALREDFEVSHKALTHWMDIFERLYHVVRVRPFASRAVASLKKMPKAYLWDWSQVSDPPARLENLVALHLLKLCHLLEDREGHRVELRYLRDRTGREVDFLVTLDNRPWFAVEVKTSGRTIDPSLFYFRDRLKIPYAYQVVLDLDREFLEDGVHCLPAADFLAALP